MPKKLSVKDIKDKLFDDTLDLSLHNLDEVPVKEISLVKRFSTLDLSNNVLTTLPKTFATLTQIYKLDLSKNMLTEIPENFGELKNLRYLDLYSNSISRLPLSLGELKHLKWLDLKENPLAPAVASVAGLCSNANECQACAKNIVIYLRKLKLTIEEEKQRRLIEIQEIERVAAVKKEARKRRKERKAAEKEKAVLKKESEISNGEPESLPVEIIDNYSPKTKDSKNGRICNLLGRAIISLAMWFILIAFLIVIVLAVFPFYDEHQSKDVFKYMERQTGVPLKQYHYEGVKLLGSFIDKTRLWTNHTREFLEKTYQLYFPKETLAKKTF